jgi:hypothetical protein
VYRRRAVIIMAEDVHLGLRRMAKEDGYITLILDAGRPAFWIGLSLENVSTIPCVWK